VELSEILIEGLPKEYRRIAEAWGEELDEQRIVYLFHTMPIGYE